jgi:hypothetical protein
MAIIVSERALMTAAVRFASGVSSSGSDLRRGLLWVGKGVEEKWEGGEGRLINEWICTSYVPREMRITNTHSAAKRGRGQ